MSAREVPDPFARLPADLAALIERYGSARAALDFSGFPSLAAQEARWETLRRAEKALVEMLVQRLPPRQP